MEQTFQTSFIPKKPIVEGDRPKMESKPVGFFTIFAIFIFFTVLIIGGGMYFYQKTLEEKLVALTIDQKKADERFEESKKKELQLFDRRLDVANQVLNKHIAVSPVFNALSKITMKEVRFTKFSYELGTDKNSNIKIKLSGETKRYVDVALQADLFSQEKNFIDPVFSNMIPNEKGNITFETEFFVDPSFVDYKTVLKSGVYGEALDDFPTNQSAPIN